MVIEPPVIVIIPAVGAKVCEALTVKALETEKLAVGWVPGVPAIVRPKKVKMAELVMPQLVPVIVIVPAVGAKVPEVTFKVPLSEKLVEQRVVLEIVRLFKVTLLPVKV